MSKILRFPLRPICFYNGHIARKSDPTAEHGKAICRRCEKQLYCTDNILNWDGKEFDWDYGRD